MKAGSKVRVREPAPSGFPLNVGEVYVVSEYAKSGEALCDGDGLVEDQPGVRIKGDGGCFFASRFEEITE